MFNQIPRFFPQINKNEGEVIPRVKSYNQKQLLPIQNIAFCPIVSVEESPNTIPAMRCKYLRNGVRVEGFCLHLANQQLISSLASMLFDRPEQNEPFLEELADVILINSK